MSKKSFWRVLWLMAGAGILALAFFIMGSRPIDKAVSPLWKIKAWPWGARQLAFSDDGKTLVAVADVGAIKSWNVADAELIDQFTTPNQTTLAPDGATYTVAHPGTLARTVTIQKLQRKWKETTSSDGSIETEPGKSSVAPLQLKLFKNRSVSLHRSRDNAVLRSFALPDDTLSKQSQIEAVFVDGREPLVLVAMGSRDFDAEGDVMATYHFIGWNSQTGKPLFKKPISRVVKAGDYDVPALENLVFSTKPHKLLGIATHYNDEKNRATNLQLRDELSGVGMSLPSSTQSEFQRPQWYPSLLSFDKRHLISISDSAGGGPIYCFDLKSRRALWKQSGESLHASAIALTRDGKILACGGTDYSSSAAGYAGHGKLILLNARTGTVLHTFTEETWRDRADQKRLAQIAKVGFRFGSKNTWGQTSKYLPGDSGAVYSLAFSPNGKTLAASYGDGSLKLWRVPKK